MLLKINGMWIYWSSFCIFSSKERMWFPLHLLLLLEMNFHLDINHKTLREELELDPRWKMISLQPLQVTVLCLNRSNQMIKAVECFTCIWLSTYEYLLKPFLCNMQTWFNSSCVFRGSMSIHKCPLWWATWPMSWIFLLSLVRLNHEIYNEWLCSW
jgi:hypothetical protein